MGYSKAGDRASVQFQQAPGLIWHVQRCGFSSCRQRFCWVVVVFTARWMKMAPVGDQENDLCFPLPA